MKHSIKNVLSLVAFLGIIAFSLSSCYEGRYYHHYHHHHREWYESHNVPPPPGIRWDVDVDVH